MQDDTRTGVRPLPINPLWYAQTYTGARAEMV